MQDWNKLDINNLPRAGDVLIIKVKSYSKPMTATLKQYEDSKRLPFFKNLASDYYFYNHTRGAKFRLCEIEAWKYSQLDKVFRRKY